MKTSELIAAIQKQCRLEHLSLNTEREYSGWARRFMAWLSDGRASLSTEERISGFLGEIASRSAESTQNQALCALIYAHKSIGAKVGRLPEWTRAKRPRRLPEWVSDSEARTVLGLLHDDAFLGCALMYGSGLRVNECARLRWRDIDLANTALIVRGAKGDKDRVTCLPSSVLSEIITKRMRADALWREDRTHGAAGVQVPNSVGRKQPLAGETFGMFWVFPAAGESRDPRSGLLRRHHLHADTFAKALAVAVRRAGLTRRITPHALRHGFATAYLINGGAIHELQELLGHASVQTTSVYLHCLPTLGARARSPLDDAPSKLIPFAPEQERHLQAV